MTSIVSVSATTAAYAAEPVKPAQRVSGGHLVEATIKDLADKAARGDDLHQRALVNVVQPPALALFFLTAQQSRPGPQTSRQAAEAAYLQSMALSLPELADDETVDAESPLDDRAHSIFLPEV